MAFRVTVEKLGDGTLIPVSSVTIIEKRGGYSLRIEIFELSRSHVRWDSLTFKGTQNEVISQALLKVDKVIEQIKREN